MASDARAPFRVAAAYGVAGDGDDFPFFEEIQYAFGAHELGDIRAHHDEMARTAASELAAEAYALGNDVAFARAPDLHTAAHEAAHVIQQRRGISLPQGMGRVGDIYERQADAVADAVVRGESAEALLGPVSAKPVEQHFTLQAKASLGAKKAGARPAPTTETLMVSGAQRLQIGNLDRVWIDVAVQVTVSPNERGNQAIPHIIATATFVSSVDGFFIEGELRFVRQAKAVKALADGSWPRPRIGGVLTCEGGALIAHRTPHADVESAGIGVFDVGQNDATFATTLKGKTLKVADDGGDDLTVTPTKEFQQLLTSSTGIAEWITHGANKIRAGSRSRGVIASHHGIDEVATQVGHEALGHQAIAVFESLSPKGAPLRDEQGSQTQTNLAARRRVRIVASVERERALGPKKVSSSLVQIALADDDATPLGWVWLSDLQAVEVKGHEDDYAIAPDLRPPNAKPGASHARVVFGPTVSVVEDGVAVSPELWGRVMRLAQWAIGQDMVHGDIAIGDMARSPKRAHKISICYQIQQKNRVTLDNIIAEAQKRFDRSSNGAVEDYRDLDGNIWYFAAWGDPRTLPAGEAEAKIVEHSLSVQKQGAQAVDGHEDESRRMPNAQKTGGVSQHTKGKAIDITFKWKAPRSGALNPWAWEPIYRHFGLMRCVNSEHWHVEAIAYQPTVEADRHETEPRK